MSRSFIPLTISGIVLCLVACASGGEKPAAKDAADAAEKPAAPAEKPAEEAEEAESAPAEAEAPKAEPQPKPTEILTTPDVAFAFDYNASELKAKHEEKCKAMKDKPSAFAACIERERATFKADVLQFVQNAEGKFVWLVFVRKGTSLSEVFQSPVEFTNEAANAVTLKLSGQGRGTQQIFQGQREIPVSLPDRYSLVIEDPKFGTLKYASKVGIAPKPQP